MYNAFIVASIVTILLSILIATLYQIRIDWYNRKRQYDIQLESAIAQQHIAKDMGWSELKTVINDVISFNVSNYIIVNNIGKMNEDELSVMWTSILRELCATVEVSLSDEVKRQAFKAISREYFTKFIKNSVEITIVYQLENNKNNQYNEKLQRIQGAVPRIGQSQEGTKNNSNNR